MAAKEHKERKETMGSAAAPAAVRRALAPNTSRGEHTNRFERAHAQEANDEGVVGCARGGRAPHFNTLRSLRSFAAK